MNTRLLAAVLIALAFVLLVLGCSSRAYPVTPSAAKGGKAQQQRLQSQFP